MLRKAGLIFLIFSVLWPVSFLPWAHTYIAPGFPYSELIWLLVALLSLGIMYVLLNWSNTRDLTNVTLIQRNCIFILSLRFFSALAVILLRFL